MEIQRLSHNEYNFMKIEVQLGVKMAADGTDFDKLELH
jgi:hypothetical protein